MKRWLTVTAVVVFAIIGVMADAQAIPLLRFDNPTVDGGTLTYDGAGGALVGTNIIFQNIIGTDTPLNSDVTLDCVGCLLDFTTGLNTQEGGTTYSWAGGGTFTLTGTAQETGGGAVVATGVLLQGTFNDPALGLAGPDNFLFIGAGEDTKHPDLLDFYGLTGFTFNFANTDIAADYTQGANGSILGTVSESDITNEGKAVPWTSSLPLIGLGLAMLGAMRLRTRFIS